MSSSSNYGDLIRRLASIRNGYADAQGDIMNHFPQYDIGRDVSEAWEVSQRQCVYIRFARLRESSK